MNNILAVGYDPDHLDLDGGGLPPGLTAEKIHQGVERGIEGLHARGWQAEHLSIRPDAQAGPSVARKLAGGRYDLVMVGAGVRLAQRHLDVFEAVINAIHQGAPGTPIAFNSGLNDLPDAAARFLA